MLFIIFGICKVGLACKAFDGVDYPKKNKAKNALLINGN